MTKIIKKTLEFPQEAGLREEDTGFPRLPPFNGDRKYPKRMEDEERSKSRWRGRNLFRRSTSHTKSILLFMRGASSSGWQLPLLLLPLLLLLLLLLLPLLLLLLLVLLPPLRRRLLLLLLLLHCDYEDGHRERTQAREVFLFVFETSVLCILNS